MNKKLFYVILSLLGFCLLFNSGTNAFADTVISWGVNPNTNERTPDPPVGSLDILKANNGLFVGSTDEKKIYFTFDLGYEAGFTCEVLDILKEHNIKAIFFLCGNYLKQSELVKRMIDEGHTIGNHTDKHKDLPKLSDELIIKDISDLQEDFIEQYKDVPMTYFRPPQGRISERVLKLVNEQKLKTVMWSIAIVDWGKTPINAQNNADKIASRLHPGAIALFHITNSGTPEMLKLLLPKIAEKGYEVGNATEL